MNTEKLIIVAAIGAGLYMFANRARATATNAETRYQTSTPGVLRSTDPGPGAWVNQINGIGAAINAITRGVGTIFGSARPQAAGDSANSAGEEAARQYYLSNADNFAVNPPDSYAEYTDTTGGWLDSQ